jgi:sulfate adenylyltransferase subunit 1 (EFTu-like GTPase family)
LRRFRDDFDEFLSGAAVHAIPMSALNGDNVITRSDRTPYFDGLPLLEYLETVQVHRNLPAAPFRFPVQLVVRTGSGLPRLRRTDCVRDRPRR